MCNLYDIGPGQGKRNETIWEKLVFRGLDLSDARQFGIRKTDPGLVILPTEAVEWMRWGFHRSFNPAINNARKDKLESGMWQSSWNSGRRCLIPLSAFYEWSGPKGKKQTHVFESPERTEWLWAAGIWEESQHEGNCFSMITTGSSSVTEPIHDRMPALLPEDQLENYLQADNPIELLQPFERLEQSPCENPLKNSSHEGPVKTGFLPGFE